MSDGMTSGTRKHAAKENEILVELTHVRRVENVLREANVKWEVKESSEDLGLARLQLADMTTAAAQVADLVAPRLTKADRYALVVGDALDRLLTGLRSYFAVEGGELPRMGKNRLAGLVTNAASQNGGVISYGGGGEPQPTREALPQPSGDAGRGLQVGLLDAQMWQAQLVADGWTVQHGEVHPTVSGLVSTDSTERYGQASGHAAFVIGLIRSRAPGATVHVRAVLDENGQAAVWDVAKEMVTLGKADIDILILPFVCYTRDHQPPLALATAIKRLAPKVVVVAAAGNHGDAAWLDDDEHREIAWPAGLDRVVAVGASDGQEPASFTPKDPRWIDVLAPGVNLVSTYLDGPVRLQSGAVEHFNRSARWEGSSFSAALVGGAIAARTVPGQCSSKDALQEILDEAKTGSQSLPPIVKLDVLTDDQPDSR